MVGRQPISFLSFDIPPEDVDVNVHPAKVEVRFRDSQKLYALLLSAIRQKFLATDLHEKLSAHGLGAGQESAGTPNPALKPADPPSQTFKQSPDTSAYTLSTTAPSRQMLTDWFSNPASSGQSGPRPTLPAATLPPFRPPSTAPYRSDAPGSPFAPRNAPSSGPPGSWSMSATNSEPFQADLEGLNLNESAGVQDAQKASSPPEIPVPIPVKQFRKAVQVHDSYLVVETEDGVSLVDQHALHERILYEELRAKLKQGGVETQRLLIPDMLELEPSEHALALEHAETLESLGLEVQDFGAPTLAILTVPLMAKHLKAGELTRILIDRFQHSQAKPDPEAFLNLTLATIACKAAVKAGDKLQPEEIEALLAKGTEFAHSHHCPHGRPSALVFTKTELEKQFGRI